MKISEITDAVCIEYLRVDPDDVEPNVLATAREAARQYILSYTGLTEAEADGCEDLTLAYMVLVQNMYDERNAAPDMKYANSQNKTVSTILNMHARNLV